MPPFKYRYWFEIILLDETFVVLVVRVIVYFFKFKEIFLGFLIFDPGIIILDCMQVVY